ncbi:phosphatidylserine decarboxylase-domain-containing protein [Crepidotus variabilis]|uniref:Phosphatidylserine decarboxylase proenzyme 1, mitochondrial n=1 Tax=Crepidotus variabilis TaxID=179855 RepID=A0A9P6ECZ1_9AGAR|nr:phosphatidylserine decarboxylase-domain-containing protein [Crepidotus variabilis]
MGMGTEVDVNEDGLDVVQLKGPWHVHILAALPLRTTSRLWGYLNSLTLPIWFRPYGLSFYAWVFGCDLSEAEHQDLRKYASLGAFFERKLRDGVRPIEGVDGEHGLGSVLVSPADGTVLHFGTVQGSRVEQVKGITYSLDALLGVERMDSQAMAAAISQANAERGMQVVDHEEFANVNGIEYTLEQLLGGDTSNSSPSTPTSEKTQSEAEAETQGQGPGQGHAAPTKFGSRTDASIPPKDQDRELEETLVHDAAVAVQMGVGVGMDVGGKPGLKRSSSSGSTSTTATGTTSTSTSTEGTVVGENEESKDGKEGLRKRHHRRSATSGDAVKPGNALFFTVIYLAPGDYHRFHSPTAWVVEKRRHFVGELFSVSPFMAKRLENLFVLNERVALLGRWRYGFFGMVPVGATNVGSIKINFDQALRTNIRGTPPPPGTYTEAAYSAASPLLRGQPLAPAEEMGGFSLGSTIVLVFEAPREFEFGVERGEKVKVGRMLGGVGKRASD